MAGTSVTEEEPFLLWVDDDHALLNHAVSRLIENNIKVLVTPTVDEAIGVIKTRRDQLIGVLVDLMMDPGKALEEYDHKAGFETGFRFIDYLCQHELVDGMKICIFTNHNPPQNFYCPDGFDLEFKIDRKSRYKAIQFVQYVERRFLSND